MFAIVTGALFMAALFMAALFETALPQDGPAPKKSEAATQAPAKKTRSANWEISIPFVGCDNGTPVPNVELPDTNAPTPLCPGKQPPDVLPQSTPTTASAPQDENYEVGTVIALGVSRAKVVIAADSRNVLLRGKKLPNGTLVESKLQSREHFGKRAI